MLIEIFLQLDGNRHTWWSEGRFLGDTSLDFRRGYWACIHVVGDVLVIIIRVVVIKIDLLQRIIISTPQVQTLEGTFAAMLYVFSYALAVFQVKYHSQGEHT